MLISGVYTGCDGRMSDRVKGQGVFYDDVKTTCNETVVGSSWKTVNHLKEQQETVECKKINSAPKFKKNK